MSLFPHFYTSVNDFSAKVGHVRRNTLLNIKDLQIEANNELQQARLELGEGSVIAQPQKWNSLFDNVLKLAIKLFEITKELETLEDIHVNTHHRVLPY